MTSLYLILQMSKDFISKILPGGTKQGQRIRWTHLFTAIQGDKDLSPKIQANDIANLV